MDFSGTKYTTCETTVNIYFRYNYIQTIQQHCKEHTTYQEDIESTSSKKMFKSQSMLRSLGSHVANKNLL